ncbi:hypothetical protein DNU06_08685 [Putridiphycobacter roseus]|uniref:Uncharacterized protein n=1 Tax=Putridiphycobacter roseus TaxID=2219161 RepID=A0A2W1NH60_9FLAO|nr:hypothetical protein [Putridiphycobacter roseus]PZE17336.1 hypothetical protein DNU06_08685 [Putridiphycobacter roseus]
MKRIREENSFIVKIMAIAMTVAAILYLLSVLINKDKASLFTGSILIALFFIAGISLLLLNGFVTRMRFKIMNSKLTQSVLFNLFSFTAFLLLPNSGIIELLIVVVGICWLLLILMPEKTANYIWKKLDL